MGVGSCWCWRGWVGRCTDCERYVGCTALIGKVADPRRLTALGCKVIATASKESKRRICIEKGGADHAIDYTTKDWQKEVMEITGGKGVDVVYDPVVSLDDV